MKELMKELMDAQMQQLGDPLGFQCTLYFP